MEVKGAGWTGGMVGVMWAGMDKVVVALGSFGEGGGGFRRRGGEVVGYPS